jgi:hypothetical protein
MVRRLGAVLGCFALVVATVSFSSPPVSAQAATTRVVPGHDLARAGLQEGWVGCTGSTPPDPKRLIRRGGTLGTHSIGWQPGVGYGAGALAHTAHPTTLGTFRGDVWFPSGHGTGYAVAFYYDGTPGGYWFGSDGLEYNGTGFATADLASDFFVWQHIVGGVLVGTHPDTTISGLAGDIAGDAGGADIGILMGCEGQPYYFDNLRVADAFNQTVYDFEGATSASRLGWTIRKNRVNYTNVTVPFGQELWMLGDSYDPAALQFIVGQGTMYQQAYGKRAVPAGSAGYDTRHYAGFHVRPQRQTSYWFTTPGNDAYDSSASSRVTVKVVADLKAGLNALQLHPGQPAIISGKLVPGNRGTKVQLQARVGRWRTVFKTKSGRGGRFRVGVIPTSPGKLVLRLKVANGGGNLGFLTIPQTVTVTPRSKPHPPAHHPAPHITPTGSPPEPVQDNPPPPPRTLSIVKAPGVRTPTLPAPAPVKPPTCTPLGPGLPTPCLPAGMG